MKNNPIKVLINEHSEMDNPMYFSGGSRISSNVLINKENVSSSEFLLKKRKRFTEKRLRRETMSILCNPNFILVHRERRGLRLGRFSESPSFHSHSIRGTIS